MRILITAGPTHEPIDAVRYIGNRSSGKMGLAIADAASDAGHDVTLLLGPVSLPDEELPEHWDVERYESTADLKSLLEAHFPFCDVLIMAAAVADYRPATPVAGKLSRGSDGLTIQLEPTPDLVASVAATRKPGQKIVAFSLEESANLVERASQKRARKGVDAIVANPLETIGSSQVQAVWITADASETLEPMSKVAFARWLVGKISQVNP